MESSGQNQNIYANNGQPTRAKQFCDEVRSSKCRILFVLIFALFSIALIGAVAIGTYSIASLQADNAALSNELKTNYTPLTDNDWKTVEELIANEVAMKEDMILSQFEVLSDSIASLKEEMATFGERQNEIETKFEQLDSSLNSVQQEVGMVDTRTKFLNESLEEANRILLKLKNIDIKNILQEINEVNVSVVGLRVEMNQLERQHTEIESEIGLVNSDVNAVMEEVGAVDDKNNQLSVALQTTDQNLEKLKQEVQRYHRKTK